MLIIQNSKYFLISMFITLFGIDDQRYGNCDKTWRIVKSILFYGNENKMIFLNFIFICINVK